MAVLGIATLYGDIVQPGPTHAFYSSLNVCVNATNGGSDDTMDASSVPPMIYPGN